MHARTSEPEIDIPAPTRLHWSPAHKQAWHEMQPAGVYLIGTPCPVSGREHSPTGLITRQWGGSFGVLLVRCGLTLQVPWTATLAAPFGKGPIGARLYWRLWTCDESRAFKVHQALTGLLRERRCEDPKNDFYSLPHDTRAEDLECEVRARTRDKTNMLLNDDELHRYCGGLVRAADARAAKGRRG